MHRESNLITVQKDVTVFRLLYFCRQLYTFRVLTPIIRRYTAVITASGTGQQDLLPSALIVELELNN